MDINNNYPKGTPLVGGICPRCSAITLDVIPLIHCNDCGTKITPTPIEDWPECYQHILTLMKTLPVYSAFHDLPISSKPLKHNNAFYFDARVPLRTPFQSVISHWFEDDYFEHIENAFLGPFCIDYWIADQAGEAIAIAGDIPLETIQLIQTRINQYRETLEQYEWRDWQTLLQKWITLGDYVRLKHIKRSIRTMPQISAPIRQWLTETITKQLKRIKIVRLDFH